MKAFASPTNGKTFLSFLDIVVRWRISSFCFFPTHSIRHVTRVFGRNERAPCDVILVSSTQKFAFCCPKSKWGKEGGCVELGFISIEGSRARKTKHSVKTFAISLIITLWHRLIFAWCANLVCSTRYFFICDVNYLSTFVGWSQHLRLSKVKDRWMAGRSFVTSFSMRKSSYRHIFILISKTCSTRTTGNEKKLNYS